MNPNDIYKSLIIELAAITTIIINRNFYAVFAFFVLHSLASFFISKIIVFLLPKNYKKNQILNLLFFTVLNSITLFAGYFASLYLVSVLLRKYSSKEKYEIETMDYSQLLIFPATKRQIGEASANLELSKISKEIKMNLLKTFNQETTTISVRLIKNLLTDYDWEIRLYSFQTLSKIKNEISSKINKTIKELENTNNNYEKAKSHKKLSTLYFDMFELEVIEESLRNFFIEKSLFHITEAEKIMGDGELLFIRGKILKSQKKYDQAIKILELSIKYKFDEHKVLPIIAEIYYEKKEFDKIKSIFKKDYSLKIDFNTAPFYQIWEGG